MLQDGRHFFADELSVTALIDNRHACGAVDDVAFASYGDD
jgi:hypothetical protein